MINAQLSVACLNITMQSTIPMYSITGNTIDATHKKSKHMLCCGLYCRKAVIDQNLFL